MIQPLYHGRFEPVYPCRVMETRHCPAILDSVCPVLCARFEEIDQGELERLWLSEDE